MELRVRNVNQAFKEAWWLIRAHGVSRGSRNGPVLMLPEPLMTTYNKPMERVLFSPKRDANPVFHLVEAIWMLAGRHDVGTLLPFNANYQSYAEPDGTVHGAYGFRWRHHFDRDQLEEVVEELRRDPLSRRAVVAMWDPRSEDMGKWRDTPCNTHIYFDTQDAKLNMTVLCRSNDMLWGAYGANVVHFSILQELIAEELGCEVGVYRQFSNNFHVYPTNEMVREFMLSPPYDDYDYYQLRSDKLEVVQHLPLIAADEGMEDFLRDCHVFFDPEAEMRTMFMAGVARPLARSYLARKAGDIATAMLELEKVSYCDWKLAYMEWWSRRPAKVEVKK